ncbi:MAG: hypothetical protein ACK5CW_18865, partial [Verrucomicrobiota bacterium]
MIGHRHRWHSQLGRLLDHIINPARPIESRKLGVQMKMDRLPPPAAARARQKSTTRKFLISVLGTRGLCG